MSSKKGCSRDVPDIRVFFGDLRKMTSTEVADGDISLVVTSPPYFNAPFDYPDLFPSYEDYLGLVRSFAHQSRRVLRTGGFSAIDTAQLNKERWNLTVWNITNVLPFSGRVEEGIAAFPEEIPRRLIKLFTMVGETVFDPFAGSGTTLKVARELGRNGIGYEIDLELKRVLRKKLGGHGLILEEREGARRLRRSLQTRIHQNRSVAR